MKATVPVNSNSERAAVVLAMTDPVVKAATVITGTLMALPCSPWHVLKIVTDQISAIQSAHQRTNGNGLRLHDGAPTPTPGPPDEPLPFDLPTTDNGRDTGE